jgi:hypothetical protein
LELAHHEYPELFYFILHLTRVRAPFEGYEGVETQIEVARKEFVLVLERWRILVVEESR